ncbi:hypothetical protein [Nonomuraea turcica]|uniref:hypothetical protein n=1 Tax=Nonomuraea sp. G32 TaxID=3067274 RepID=UPI00273C78CD|nr:hypothetical protein [Nonomuraea sp. G32]MDP4511806.1 hypothetical protein [Nonomuraea sp. G32]
MTKDARNKQKTRAYAAAHNLTYQQAHQALTRQAGQPDQQPKQQSRASLLSVDADELVRLVLADKAAAGIHTTEEQARRDVAFTLGMLDRYLTSEPYTPTKTDGIPLLVGPHCQHDENCATDVCQDGYAHFACRRPGCPICGAPPNSTPEHWAGDVVAQAVMSPADVARAEAHLKAFPLLRRPNDLPVLSEERFHQAYPEGLEWWDPDRCDECGAYPPEGYSCDCPVGGDW